MPMIHSKWHVRYRRRYVRRRRGISMKSIFFHLMPYRDLPADFETKYESIWVTPPNSELCDPKKVAQYYQWNLDELELADRLGFDGVGVNEHQQHGSGF